MRENLVNLSQGLRFRISAAFFLVGLILSIALTSALDYALDFIGERYVETLLTENLEMVIARWREDPSAQLPFSTAMRAYVSTSEAGQRIPDSLSSLLPGIHEIEEPQRDLQVGVRDAGGARFVLTVDTSSLDLVEDDLDLALAAGVVAFSLLSLWLGYWGAGRVIAPVRTLAAEVRSLDHDAHRGQLVLRGAWSRDEVGELARAFEAYAGRLQGFIARERSFTADVSHELRNPIMVASSSLDLLLETPDPDPERQRRLERLHRAVTRMSELVDVFLALARENPASPDPAAHPPALDMEAICREVLARYEDRARQKGLSLELVVTGRPAAAGAASSARVVVDNLLSNAIRYTQQGSIQVLLSEQGIDIADSGPGIPGDESDRIYDRAFRGTNASGQGFGLGLNIVKRLCEHNRWAVSVRNGNAGGAVAAIRFTSASS